MILGSVRHVRVFVYREPVDMRKAYDTLAALVEGPMKKSLLSGDIFVFIGRRRKRAKALYFDGTGLCLLAKRLDRRAYRIPLAIPAGAQHVTVSARELSLLLEGIDEAALRAARRSIDVSR